MLARALNATAAPQSSAASEKAVLMTVIPMQNLRRPALWGSMAAVALLVAALTTRSDLGSQRATALLSSLQSGHQIQTTQAPAQVQAPRFDAEIAIRQLAQAVRGLTEDREQLMTRLGAVERNMDDMTGSITKQIEAAKAAEPSPSASPWPGNVPPTAMTPETIAAMVAPAAGLAAAASPSSLAAASDAGSSGAPAGAYGVDVGSAISIPALHARWAGIRSLHAQLFEGLNPVVMLKEIPKTKRAELHLVLGPLASADAAAQLCAALARFRLPCQPTSFEGQHLALQ